MSDLSDAAPWIAIGAAAATSDQVNTAYNNATAGNDDIDAGEGAGSTTCGRVADGALAGAIDAGRF